MLLNLKKYLLYVKYSREYSYEVYNVQKKIACRARADHPRGCPPTSLDF
jgi:hypothetical protein